LRFEQDDVGEAHKLFKKATELDPLYISAWKKRQEIMKSIMVSKEESDEIILNNLKLDPKNDDFYTSKQIVWDVKKLWMILSESNVLFSDLDENLYVLQASKERINKDEEGRYYYDSYLKNTNKKEKILTDHSLLTPLYEFEVLLGM